MNPARPWQGARDHLRRFLDRPKPGASRGRRALRLVLLAGQRCAGALRRDQAGQQAAALTYHTLFSLLPMTVLVLIALNGFVGAEGRERLTRSAADWTIGILQPESAGDADAVAAAGVPAGTGAGAPEADAADTTRAVRAEGAAGTAGAAGPPTTPEEEFNIVRRGLEDRFREFLDRLQNVDLSGVGALGALVFVWAATGLLGTVESSFNRIVGAASGRPWYLRIPLYYTAVTLGPLVLLAGMWVRGQLFDALEAGSWLAWLAGPAWFAAQVASTWLVLYLVYVLLPAGPVGKKAAAAGSFVAAVLFLAARDLFGLYVTEGILGSLYGALALLPLLLLLIWIVWLIVLLGLELTVVLEDFADDRPAVSSDGAFDAVRILPLAARVAQVFRGGGISFVGDLSRDTGLGDAEVRRLLNRLESMNVVRRVEDDEKAGFVLARPAASIPLRELLRPAPPGAESAEPAERADATAGFWIRDLLERSGWLEEGKTLEDAVRLPGAGEDGRTGADRSRRERSRDGLSD